MTPEEFLDNLEGGGFWEDDCIVCNQTFNAPNNEEVCPACITKACNACKGKGWIFAERMEDGVIEVQRCDSCKLYSSDKEAGMAMLDEMAS